MTSSGYSGTPLIKKLGIKPGYRVRVVNMPHNYRELLGDLPEGVMVTSGPDHTSDMIHYFATDREQLHKDIDSLRAGMEANGMIWVSWYKKSSGMVTDIDENTIRDLALKSGLVDVKVCAVDERWSALKLVIRLKDRPK